MKYYILGPFVLLRSNTLTLKETNPLYPHCLISEPGFWLPDGWFEISGHSTHTQRPGPF